MYRIDRSNNTIEPLKECSFAGLGFRERAHLQEWIAKYPEALGEELLVIQKEFAGFSDTQERLDLLALDKEGSLVIIEHKLDDTGRDVTWQALKYASYCARLTKEEIRQIYQAYLDRTEPDQKADDRLSAFFDVEDFQELTLNKGPHTTHHHGSCKFSKGSHLDCRMADELQDSNSMLQGNAFLYGR